MTRPRLLQVVLSLTPGGAESLVIALCRRLGEHFDFAVCCLDGVGPWADELRRSGVEVIGLERPPGFHPSLGRRIAAVARARGATLLHCHQYSPFVYGRVAQLCDSRLRVIYTEHGRLSDAPPSWKRQAVNPLLGRFSGAVVAVSCELREYMVRARFPRRRVRVIHNGIDPGAVVTADERLRARRALGFAAGTPVIATVARLDPVKDLLTLLNAVALVRRTLPEARLVIAGDGRERATLEARAAAPDLHGAVTFIGMRSDVRRLLPAADVYANSSISEGVSITILEAMAASVPVVATRAGGTPEVVQDGETGVLVPSRDPARLAAALLTLTTDPAGRRHIGAAGRRRLEAAFTLQRMAADYQRLYHACLE